MIPLAVAAGAFALAVAAPGALAYFGMREQSDAVAAEEKRVERLTSLLQQVTQGYLTLCLTDGGEVAGWVVAVSKEEQVVFINAQRFSRDKDGSPKEPSGENLPGPSDVTVVDLREVESVEVYREESHAGSEEEEDDLDFFEEGDVE